MKVIPLVEFYAVSCIEKNDKFSLHLARTFNQIKGTHLTATAFDKTNPNKKRVILEHLNEDEQFSFDNPLITSNINEVIDFIKEAQLWSKERFLKHCRDLINQTK